MYTLNRDFYSSNTPLQRDARLLLTLVLKYQISIDSELCVVFGCCFRRVVQRCFVVLFDVVVQYGAGHG